jgi:hypothetical protein
VKSFTSRRTLVVLALVAGLVGTVGAYSRMHVRTPALSSRQLEPDAKAPHKTVGRAAATA